MQAALEARLPCAAPRKILFVRPFDATMNLDYDPDPDLGGARFPPTVWPSDADRDAALARWPQFGLAPPKRK